MFTSFVFLIPVFGTVWDETATTAFAFPILPQRQRHRNHHQQPKQQQQQHLSPRSFSSFTFGTTNGKIPCAVIPTPYFAENGDNNNDSAKAAATDTTTNIDAVKKSNGTVTGKSSSTTSTKSTFQMIDELAQQLKVSALQANAKAALYTTTTASTGIGGSSSSSRFVFTKYRYYFQACVCYTLFLLYRAYRGFFIILPAVFRETFRKLQNAVDDTPFEDDNDSVTLPENPEGKVSASDGVIQPKPMTVRTRITISIISMFVLATYVMGGAIRVTTSFVKSIINGSSIVQSLQNAIQIQERNELTLLQKSSAATPNTDDESTTQRGPIVNGFAP